MTDEIYCLGCGGTMAQHVRTLHCRCDHTRYCADYPNCNPSCRLSPVQRADRTHSLANRLLESADRSVEQPPQYRRSALFHILEDAAAYGAKPIAWRVRGYSQFRTGEPTAWRYFDGPERPAVNDPANCDFEPLFR